MKSEASFTNVDGGRLQKAVRKELDKSTKGQTVKRLNAAASVSLSALRSTKNSGYNDRSRHR